MKLCTTCQAEYPDAVEFCAKDGTALTAKVEPGRGGDPLVGTVLGGKLRIERKVAEGGMGRIYEARHVRLGRRLAVKVLSDQFTQNEQAVVRFQREAQTAAALESPNIVEIIDIDRTPQGQYYIVMEFLEGEELRATIRREGTLALDRIVRIYRQVGRALDAAHGQGIVHRDLKPENVFLCRKGDGEEVAKIVDFGISKIRSGDAKLTQTGAIIGTPYYMAPEQAKGDTALDHRADIYALGAILYEMTTGRLPAMGDSPTGILMKIILEDPTPPRVVNPSIPEEVEAVIIKAMAKSPDERFQSVGALVDALTAAAMGGFATGIPSTAPHPAVSTVGPGAPLSHAGPHPAAAPAGMAPTAMGAGPWGAPQIPPAAGSVSGAPASGVGPAMAYSTPAPGAAYSTPAPGAAYSTPAPGAAYSTPAPGAAYSTPAPGFATPTPTGGSGYALGMATPAPGSTAGPKRSMAWVVIVGVVAGCLVLGGTVAWAVLAHRDGGPSTAVDTPPPPPLAAAPEGQGQPPAPDPTPPAAPTKTSSVEVLFTSDPPGADVLRDGEVLCSPTPCSAPFPANSGEVVIALHAEGRRDATLRFETHETNMTVAGQLLEAGGRPRRPRPGETAPEPPTKAGPGPTPSPGPTGPGFAGSPFEKAPPRPRPTGPAVVGNPFGD